MGHQSQNLLTEADLSRYTGVVASPVNYTESELAEHVKTARFRRSFDIVFDPQLYVPRTDRGQLKTWTYFPADVDTADLASDDWWDRMVVEIREAAIRVRADAVCSPAVIPRSFSDDYFERTIANGTALKQKLAGSDIRPLQTLVVNLPELAEFTRVMTIASAASKSECHEIYIVFVGDSPPRQELSEPDEIKGALRLISELRRADMTVFVAFSSSDVVLWKAAGATHCGTGKFFNLRRFTRSRFEEPTEGGGQLPYWFEESLLAFLRASDLQRVQKANMLSAASESNPFKDAILTAIPNKKPWIALAWRQYLYWFADVQSRIDKGEVNVGAMLQSAEDHWQRLDKAKPPVLMEEPSNNGAWVRQWRRALVEHPYPE
jgi:hypothetical protein